MVKLGDVCSFEKEQDVHANLPYVGLEDIESGTGRFLGAANPASVKSATFRFSPRHVLYGRLRPYLNKVLLPNFEGHCSTEIFPIRPTREILREYLFYWLSMDATVSSINATSTGARMPRANMNAVLDFEISVPSLPEQRRIVAILDEAFEGIATAKANAEKNLQNARELFVGSLQGVFSGSGEGWSVNRVGAVADCCLGKMLDKAKNKGDAKPYLRNLNVRWFAFDLTDVQEMRFMPDEYQRYSVRQGDVVICEGGYPGRAAVWEDEEPIFIQKALHRVRFTDAVLGRWFLYYLYSQEVSGALRQYFTGSGIQHFTGAALSRLNMPLAPSAVIATLVKRFDALAAAVISLEAIYRSKVAALDELKKSLLHQAFTGQFTSAQPAGIARQPAQKTTTPEFTANVIAFAHAQHEKQYRDKTFGHVKAQKVLHVVESIAKIDLGRYPIKDAAGPNDSRHMHEAEDWARSHGFFDMVKRGEGYEFTKLGSFEACMSRARASLKPHLSQLEKVIDILVPMVTKDAEVFVTVHAAWNNLLIDRAEATDDAIVWAARESWHANKLRIEEHKFRDAIALIRRTGLVPDGTAKYVGGQQPLL